MSAAGLGAVAAVPLWVELAVSALLVCSAVFVLAAAWGIVRLKDFFQRMHPPALISVWGSWCVTLASILYFSMLGRKLDLHVWIIIILLSVTVPITTLLLARAALFRGRQSGQPLPPPLQPLQPQGGKKSGAEDPADHPAP